MSYQLRSRKDPASLDIQEQTDILEGNLTEAQVATSSQTLVVPPQLSNVEEMALPVTEANPIQATLSASMKLETVSTSSLDFEGPTRFDPDLGSATVSVGALPPADAVGPPSAVMSSRDTTYIGNQPQQLYDTIDTSLLSLTHDRQEVKHTNTQGTTISFLPTILYLKTTDQRLEPTNPSLFWRPFNKFRQEKDPAFACRISA